MRHHSACPACVCSSTGKALSAYLGCRCRSTERPLATLEQTHTPMRAADIRVWTAKDTAKRSTESTMKSMQSQYYQTQCCSTPPVTVKLGYANLATARMKLISATTVGRCRRTASRDKSGARVYCSVQKDGVMTDDAAAVSCPLAAFWVSRWDCPAKQATFVKQWRWNSLRRAWSQLLQMMSTKV